MVKANNLHGCKAMGLRVEWLDQLMALGEEFWSCNTLSSAQKEAFGGQLRDGGIVDKRNRLTSFGLTIQAAYACHAQMCWELILVNLCHNSFVAGWVANNIPAGETYCNATIRHGIETQGYDNPAGTIRLATGAYINTIVASPIGSMLRQGIPNGRNTFVREEHQSVGPVSVAFALYKLAEATGERRFTVDDLLAGKHPDSPAQIFCLSRETLLTTLRALNSSANRVLIAELQMGLNHITLRDNLDSTAALQVLIG